MAQVINLVNVMNSLHNLMGHRVNPGGTDDDLKRFAQESFNYCWRYYRWNFSLKTGTSDVDGYLPTDFDPSGYYSIADTYGVVWDASQAKFKFDPVVETEFTYQTAPPTLGEDAAGSAPFPSAQVVALGATVYAKQAENPTRADIQQEWDLFHSELDRLVGRAYANTPRRPQNYHDRTGTYTGDVGA